MCWTECKEDREYHVNQSFVCISSCPTHHKFHEYNHYTCYDKCPSWALYYIPENVCYRKCPPQHYKATTSYQCPRNNKGLGGSKQVRILGANYVYYSTAPSSYARVDWAISSSEECALFLQFSENVLGLQLHVTSSYYPSYVPALFFRTPVLV